MSALAQNRVAEVIRRMRPNKPKPAEHPDIRGYCERCQAAYRLAWNIFSKIAESVKVEDITRDNMDIKIRHRIHYSSDKPSHVTTPDQKLVEHTYSLYDHVQDDYMVHAGVLILIPKKAHQTMCRGITMQIDLPIRRNCPYQIKQHTEKLLGDIAAMTQMTQPEGLSVVDQKATDWAIESKIKVVIGDPSEGIPPEEGWLRKKTYYHQIGDQSREAATQLDNHRGNVRSRSEAETDIIEVMEIDFEEAPQPPEVNRQKRADKETQSIDSTKAVLGARQRRATIPEPTTSRRRPGVSEDEILLRRRLKTPMQVILEPQPRRWPEAHQIGRLQQEARRQAESERCGNL